MHQMANNTNYKMFNLIGEIFKLISEYEKKSETIRQVLNDNNSFNPVAIFNCLDLQSKGNLCYQNLYEYLNSNLIYCDHETVKMFVSFYDINQDGNLNYYEFKNLIFSAKDRGAKNLQESYQGDIFISADIEYTFIKLLVSEIKFANKLVQLLKQLSKEVNYNAWNLFRQIDSEGRDYITIEM
jgi:hypothetical protein